MRIIICIYIIMAGLTILTPTNYANAESTEEYFKITSATTFVADTSGDEFVIPETYYVLKNETQDNGNFYYVTYMEITGKILKTLVDTAVEDVYEPYFPRIIYTNSADTIVFDFSQTTIATLPENTNLDFVGSYNMLSFGNHVPTFYVRYLDGETTKYGYILPTSTNNPDLAENIPAYVDNNPNPIINNDDDTEPVINNDTDRTPIDLLRILLILGISVPAIIVVFLLFKPTNKSHGRRPNSKYRYDEDYYNDEQYNNHNRRDRYRDDYYDRPPYDRDDRYRRY